MLFPDGPPQPDLFIAERLPHRLRNSVAARANSGALCPSPAACLAQGESDAGQMEVGVLPAPSSETQNISKRVIQLARDAFALIITKDLRRAGRRLIALIRLTATKIDEIPCIFSRLM